MKILLAMICAFMICVCTVSAQMHAPPDKLWGLQFGSTITECEKIINANKGKTIVKLTNEFLYKKGVVIGKDTAYTVLLKFNKKKLYGFTITFKPDYTLYKKIREIISNNYTKPLSEESSFILPYKRGDGREAEAVINRKAKIWCLWSNSSIVPLDRTIDLRIKRGEDTVGKPFALLEIECSVDEFAP